MPSLARSLLALAAGAAAAQAFVVPAQQAFSLPDQLGKLTHAAADKAFDVLTDSWDLLQHVATDAVGTQCASSACSLWLGASPVVTQRRG